MTLDGYLTDLREREKRLTSIDLENKCVNDSNELRVNVLNDFAKKSDTLDPAMVSIQQHYIYIRGVIQN